LLFWPRAIFGLFSSNRGQQAFDNFTDPGDYIHRISRFRLYFDRGMFGNILTDLLILIIILFVLSIAFFIIEQKNENSSLTSFIRFINRVNWMPVVFLLFTTSGYFFIVARIAPVFAQRYMLSIYPSSALLVLLLIHHTAKLIHKHMKIASLIIISIVVIHGNLNWRSWSMQYLYQGHPNIPLIMADYDKSMLIVAAYGFSPNEVSVNLVDFMSFEKVFLAISPESLIEALNYVDPENELFIYTFNRINYPEIFDLVNESFPNSERILVFSTGSIPRTFYAYRVIR